MTAPHDDCVYHIVFEEEYEDSDEEDGGGPDSELVPLGGCSVSCGAGTQLWGCKGSKKACGKGELFNIRSETNSSSGKIINIYGI